MRFWLSKGLFSCHSSRLTLAHNMKLSFCTVFFVLAKPKLTWLCEFVLMTDATADVCLNSRQFFNLVTLNVYAVKKKGCNFLMKSGKNLKIKTRENSEKSQSVQREKHTMLNIVVKNIRFLIF